MLIKTLALCLSIVAAACAPIAPDNGTAVSIRVPVDDPGTKAVNGTLYEPLGSGPFPVVLLLNGCGGVSQDSSIFRSVNRDYLPKGIATLIVDSFGSRGIGQPCSNVKAIDESIVFSVRDVYATMTWLGTRPEIDSKRIFLQGYSNGARVAIAAIDAEVPIADDAMAKQQPVAHPKVAGVIAYYPYCFAKTKFSVPTQIYIGEKDDMTPAPRCEAIIDKTNVELKVYPNAVHAFADPAPEHTFQGHRMGPDRTATADAQQLALQLIQTQVK